MRNKYVVVDLETTGNSPKKGDKIIQFAAVVIENGQIVDKYSSLVCPEQPIPAFIEELTGLSDDMVKDAPLFAEIAPKVLELLNGACFVAHNVLFDLTFLQEELIMAGYDGFYGSVLDTVEMARILLPSSDSFKLSDLAVQEGLHHDRPHQADSDAYVTGELLLILYERLRSFPLQTLNQLYILSGGLKSDLDEVLAGLVIEKETKLEDIPVHLEQYRGISLKRKNQPVEQLNRRYADAYPETELEKEQLLKNAFPVYEKRSGQFQMMDLVFQSFQQERHAMIEAGTGVGKSLAYLLPAVLTALNKKEPVIISTYTTQLQEQLVQKDIPILKKLVDCPFETVLLKGKDHYISLEKFERSLWETDENYDTILTKMQIIVWLTETMTGDRDELNLSSGGQLFWNKIKHDDISLRQGHLWKKYDFYLQTRKTAQEADLIITNHSFLLSDLVAERPILPRSEFVVIDEGHHFDKAARKYFGMKLDYAGTRYFLHQMGMLEQKQLSFKMENMLSENDVHEEGLLPSLELNKLIAELLFEMDELFKMVSIQVNKRTISKTQSRISYLLKDEITRESQLLIGCAERFLFLLKDCLKDITAKYELLQKRIDKKAKKQQIVLSEIFSWLVDGEKMIQRIRGVLLQPDQSYVRWIEIDTRAPQNITIVYSEPVSVSNQLNEQFFQQKKSVVITSATLSVKGSFQYMLNELGLHSTACIQKQIPSPFHYDKQVQLVIPNDLPEVNMVSLQEYVSVIGEHIISLAEATKGRMLILFTSHEMLRKTYELLKESGFLQDYSILAQGITGGSRTRLTRNFRRFEKAILLGTNSFWEGIDIPGEDLSCLVIVRLPFSPPDKPQTKAKCREIKEKGGNAFNDYSLPEAVLRFKQGFGRLIRTKNDKGVMVIFDRRIVSTYYGRAFLESIPAVREKEMSIDQMVSLINKWL